MAAIFIGKLGKFMQSLQSYECTLRTELFEPSGHFPEMKLSGDWGGRSGWSPAMRNCGYDQKLSSSHTVRTLPLSKILSNP
jgi:hypothetical protein